MKIERICPNLDNNPANTELAIDIPSLMQDSPSGKQSELLPQSPNNSFAVIVHKIEEYLKRDFGNIAMQGWLFKSGQIRKWNRRFVILRKNKVIEWYLSNQEAKVRAGIDIKQLVGVRDMTSHYQYTNSLQTTHDVFANNNNNDEVTMDDSYSGFEDSRSKDIEKSVDDDIMTDDKGNIVKEIAKLKEIEKRKK